MLRYNTDTERWRRRHAGCIRQAQNWKGRYQNSHNQVQNLQNQVQNLNQQLLALQNNPHRIGMAGYIPQVLVETTTKILSISSMSLEDISLPLVIIWEIMQIG